MVQQPALVSVHELSHSKRDIFMLFHSHISEGEFLQLQPECLPLNSCGFQAWRWLASTGDFTKSPAETNKGAGQRNVWFHRTTAERMWWETSTELSTEFSLIGVTLCSRLKHVHSHCWRVSSIFSVILMTHVSVFRLSRVEPECLPCLTYGGLFPERVGPVCLSVCGSEEERVRKPRTNTPTLTESLFPV